MTWDPHITVAAVIEKDGKYLMVEELSNNTAVINQPAGHVDGNETLQQAALREVREETGWEVKLTGIVGYYSYTSPTNGVTYYRVAFAADAIGPIPNATLDEDIIRTQWLTVEQIAAPQTQLRSPIVLKSIRDYLSGHRAPLDFIFESHPEGWLIDPE